MKIRYPMEEFGRLKNFLLIYFYVFLTSVLFFSGRKIKKRKRCSINRIDFDETDEKCTENPEREILKAIFWEKLGKKQR